MPIPAGFAEFDVADSNVTLWLFKKSGGANGEVPTFTGRWIELNDPLQSALKDAVIAERDRIEETLEYSLLAQNNEGSALSIGVVETHADLILERTENPLPGKKVSNESQIRNTSFYVIKFTVGDSALLAVRKTDSSWRTARRSNLIDFVFTNEALALDLSPKFSLSKYIDFFIFDEEILISNKKNFESVLSYRQAHADDFAQLQAEQEFCSIFTDLAPLVAYVGSNKMQLRRACAIRQKGHYRDDQFLNRLRQRSLDARLTLEFDQDGLIVPSPETCPNIITALLDHRVISVFSENVYDVQNAIEVA